MTDPDTIDMMIFIFCLLTATLKVFPKASTTLIGLCIIAFFCILSCVLNLMLSGDLLGNLFINTNLGKFGSSFVSMFISYQVIGWFLFLTFILLSIKDGQQEQDDVKTHSAENR